MSPEITKIIEQYLQNELSEADRAAFDKKLAENDRLLSEVVLQKRLHEAAERAAVRTLVKQTARRYHFRKQLTTAAIAVVIATAVAAATWLVVGSDSGRGSSGSEKAFLRLTERLDRSAPMEGIDVQYFNLSRQDTVVLSREGVLLSVPEGAFLLNGKLYAGPRVLQWQEAVQASDIVKGGLSTMSGDQLLETQGMFGLQAFTPGGEQLDVNPKVGVYVQVPVDELKNGMMLFEGKKGSNGMIDWQNPQPLEKLPVMAGMSELDFYPPGYEVELNRLKWKTGKKDRDSLYLSMEMENRTGTEERPLFGFSWSPATEHEQDLHEAFGRQLRETNALQAPRELSRYEVGKTLFDKKCQTCHQPHTDGTGPKLYEVREKWTSGGAKPGSIYQWVRNWKKAVATDPFAAQVAKMKPGDTQDFPELSNNEIDAIFDYIDGVSIYDVSNREISEAFEDYGIPPSRVLAFWNPKFDNTILATRDFERRMQAVHHTCTGVVLARYTDNLNKPLHEIDAMIARMGYTQFADFAAERVGAVKLDNPHMNNLRQFYDRTAAQLRIRAKKDRSFIRKQELAYDNMLNRSRREENDRTAKREAASLQEETDFNLASAMRQLGKNNVGFTIREGGKAVPGNNQDPPANVYNVDRFVAETTSARKTGTFTDSGTGKTATIVYNDFSVSVKDPGNYDRLMLYLFPHELNSFQRIDHEGGKFSYSLNGGITYNIAIVGIGESGHFIYEQRAVKSGNHGSVSLKKVSEAAFNNCIEALNGNSRKTRSGIADELDWLLKEQQNYKVQRLRMENAAFRNRIRGVVFPCAEGEYSAPGDSTVAI